MATWLRIACGLDRGVNCSADRALWLFDKASNCIVNQITSAWRLPMGTTEVERLLFAGMLQQWSTLHRKAGGRDVKTMKREDLLSDGVPLKARSSRRSTPLRAPPWIRYKAEQEKLDKADGIQRTREQYVEVTRKRKADFDALLPEQKRRYIKASSNVVPECIDAGGETTEERVAKILWGLASVSLPLAEEAAEGVVRDAFDGRVPGASAVMDHFRASLKSKEIILDEGQGLSLSRVWLAMLPRPATKALVRHCRGVP